MERQMDIGNDDSARAKRDMFGVMPPSSEPREERLTAAHRRVKEERLNAAILYEMDDAYHSRITVITPEGGEIVLEGDEETVHTQFIHFLDRRSSVRRTKSVCGGEVPPRTNEYEPLGQLTLLLDVAHRAHLFNGTNGNMS